MTILNETYTLSNGVKIPKLGLGAWMIDNDVVDRAVKDAATASGRVAFPESRSSSPRSSRPQ